MHVGADVDQVDRRSDRPSSEAGSARRCPWCRHHPSPGMPRVNVPPAGDPAGDLLRGGWVPCTPRSARANRASPRRCGQALRLRPAPLTLSNLGRAPRLMFETLTKGFRAARNRLAGSHRAHRREHRSRAARCPALPPRSRRRVRRHQERSSPGSRRRPIGQDGPDRGQDQGEGQEDQGRSPPSSSSRSARTSSRTMMSLRGRADRLRQEAEAHRHHDGGAPGVG